MLRFLAKLITTLFFIGYLPVIPGTFGSVAGLLVFIVFKSNFYLLLLCTLLIVTSGFLLSGKVAISFNRRDPPQIVIDEISGMLVSFLALPLGQASSSEEGKLIILLGFIIFRILDAAKLFPANRLHRCKGSLGIMGDDLVAGIYTNFILRFLIRFLL